MGLPSILCVDDEKTILSSLKEQLNFKYGDDYNILTAESAFEALELIEELRTREEDVPLIITDYIMPGMKGDGLLKCIHETNPRTVALFLTGQATIEGIANAINFSSMFRCITKPWNKNALYSNVSEMLTYYHKEVLQVEENKRLKAKKQELEQDVQSKSEQLEKTLKILKYANRIEHSKELIEDISNESSKSFSLIKSGVEMLHNHHQNISENDPKGIADYMKSIDEFYKTTAKVIDNLVDAFDRNTIKYILQPTEGLEGIFDEASLIRRRIAESTNGLLNKTKEIETQYNNELGRIAAWKDEEIYIISLEDILYFSSEGGNTFVETKQGNFKVRDSLEILEARLDAKKFIRCHRGFLVNLDNVSKIMPWIGRNYILKFKDFSHEVPVSKHRLKYIKNALNI